MPVIGEVAWENLMRVDFEEGIHAPAMRVGTGRNWDWRTYDSLEQVREIWKSLEDESTHRVFQTYDWVKSWYGAVGIHRAVRPFVMVGFDRGKPMVLFPFGIKKTRTLTSIVWLADDWGDYNMPLISNDVELRSGDPSAIWKTVIGQAGKIDIVELAKQSPASGHMIDNPLFHPSIVEEDNKAFLLELTSDIDDLKAAIHSPKTWHGYQRKFKKLSKNHVGVRFEEAKLPEERDALMHRLLVAKEKELRQSGKSNAFADPCSIEFLRSVASNPTGPARLFSLFADGEPIAITLCLQEQRSLLLYQTVYDTDFYRYSPGILLLHHIILTAAAEGNICFDCSFGADEYKKQICTRSVDVGRILVARTWKGHAYKWMRTAILSVRRKIKAEPVLYKTALRINSRLNRA